MRRSRSPRLAFALAVTASLAVACADGPSDAHSAAHDATRDRAEEFGVWMTNQQPRSMNDFASLADGDRSPVLSATDDRGEWRVVVRLTDESDDGPWETSAGSACWAYRALDGSVEPKPTAVSCPLGDPPTIAPTTTSTPASLGEGAEELLRKTLDELGPGQRSDEAAVRRAVTEAFAGRAGIDVDVTVHLGVAGVALRVGGERGIGVDHCLLGRAEPVEVWTPAPEYLLPGEVGCYAVDGATGALKRGPH